MSLALEVGVVFCPWSLREGKALQVIAKRVEWEKERGQSNSLIRHLKRITNDSILENHLSSILWWCAEIWQKFRKIRFQTKLQSY